MELPTRFKDHQELARLPYFDLDPSGRLVLADASLGPAIDCHTHLALAYLRPMALDLHRSHEHAEHYLPLERALDLDVYANKNFTEQDLARMSRDLTRGAVTAGGMRATHTLSNLAREMGELGIVRSVLLPIDFPVLSDNAGAYLRAAEGRGEFVVFGSVHPLARHVERKLDQQMARGARGIKVHPAVQLIRPDARRALRLYDLCGDRGLPVLWHCGPVGIEPRLGRYLSQVRHYVAAIKHCPRTLFFLGHSGALQLDEALELANAHHNVVLELASQSLPGMRKIFERGPTDRVVFGTDWPFYHQSMGLAKVLMATEGDEALRRAVLHDNAARLLNID